MAQKCVEVKKKWRRGEIVELIQLVEQNPVLWDISKKEYRNRNKKAAEHECLAEKFGTSVNEITRKLHNLRCQFHSETRKVRRKSNPESGNIFKSNWEFYDMLTFLAPSVTKKVASSLSSNHSSEDEVSVFPEIQINDVASDFEQTNSTCEPKVKKMAKKRTRESNDTSRLSMDMSTIQEMRDEYQIFGDFVASELRCIKTDYFRKKMKLAIQKILFTIGEEALESENAMLFAS